MKVIKTTLNNSVLNEMLDLVGGLGISAICSSIPALLAHQRCLTIYDPLEINDYEVESKIFASVSNAMRIKTYNLLKKRLETYELILHEGAKKLA